ncbi:hypothetical protein MVES_003418 [Malassezia vespertilionis]|uniref:RNA helicase n=1 Tax=Malassezia vespertilionis TaxID=2020962 RepID=A0A2N1J7S1_9BASI|nr:hypothetical protein MVES_003418 [Malassezia vespertilionis]
MAFWKPGVGRPASALDRASVRESDASIDVSAAFAPPSAELKSRLPVAKHRNALLYLVEQHGVVIVVGHTGSGKTTQIPQYLLEAGWAADGRQIVCTQPRRVAATSVAARVAQEMGVRVGEEVGYAVRFENCTDPQRTRLKYVTPGLLFRECMQDPLLSRYSVVMVDEAHERGVYTDLLIAVLKNATLDAEAFARYFDPDYDGANTENVSIVSIEGQTFPVEVAYTEEPVQDYIAAAVDSVWSLHIHEPPGDVLVFLTGREEIEQVIQALADRAASVTIDGIVYVVDCGYTKEKQLDPSSGMDILSVVPASQAALAQRAGLPELVRTDPAPYLLQLKALGIDNVARFDFVPPAPNAEAMATALTYLASLQALDSSVDTPFTAYLNGPAIDVAAEIERRKFVAEEGDQLTLLNVYNAFVHPRIGRASPKWAAKHGLSYNTLRRAQTIRAQLHKYATLHWHLPMQSRTEPDVLLKCLVAGYFKNAAVRMDDGSYKAVLHGVPLHAHPSSVLFTRASPSRYVLYQEVTHTTKAMIRDIAVIEQAWLLEIAPHYYELHRPALRY